MLNYNPNIGYNSNYKSLLIRFTNSTSAESSGISSFFPGPLAFCKKAVERVNSEKNILNSSVEWSRVVFLRKSHMYVHHQIRLNELINMMYFIFDFIAYFSRN